MSHSTVPERRLIDFAKPVRREVVIDPLDVYRTVGCHLYGKGVYERETKTGVDIKASRMFSIEKDDIVINRIWAQKGSAGIVPDSLAGAVVTQDFPVWVIDPDEAFPPYIGWYLKTPNFWEECRRHSHGTSGRERLKPREIPHIVFPIPALDEQRRIVARIEELAALIEEAQGLRANAREEADSLLSATVKAVFDDQEWARVSIENLVGRENLRNGKSARPTELPTDICCLRLSSMRRGLVDCTDAKPVLLEKDEAEPYLVRRGEVFVVRGSGSKRLVGQAGLVEKCREGIVFPDLFIRVSLDQNIVLPPFFVTWWNSPQMRDIIEDAAKTTSGIWKVNQGHIASFQIPLAPLHEQRRIVAYLDDLQAQVDELTALQDATQAELDALLPSVLDRAFRGEL